MQVQTWKAIALCRAINAKTGSVYNCDNGRLTIEQRGNNMIISRETVDNTGRVLVLPLVNQYAVKPNGKATFTWLQNDLDMILKKK